MPTPPTLPTLAGLTWSRHKKPGFATRVATHASGREVRVPLMSYPLYEFEAVYSALPSRSGYGGTLGPTDQATLLGFFNQLQGQFGTFLYSDPDDNAISSQALGTGDGSTTAFQFVRALGGFVEPVGWVTALTTVYLDGVSQGSGFSLSAPNTLAFVAAPAAGVAVSASFSYAYVCRFLDDRFDFEEFLSGLYKLDSMKFRSIKSWLGG